MSSPIPFEPRTYKTPLTSDQAFPAHNTVRNFWAWQTYPTKAPPSAEKQVHNRLPMNSWLGCSVSGLGTSRVSVQMHTLRASCRSETPEDSHDRDFSEQSSTVHGADRPWCWRSGNHCSRRSFSAYHFEYCLPLSSFCRSQLVPRGGSPGSSHTHTRLLSAPSLCSWQRRFSDSSFFRNFPQ